MDPGRGAGNGSRRLARRRLVESGRRRRRNARRARLVVPLPVRRAGRGSVDTAAARARDLRRRLAERLASVAQRKHVSRPRSRDRSPADRERALHTVRGTASGHLGKAAAAALENPADARSESSVGSHDVARPHGRMGGLGRAGRSVASGRDRLAWNGAARRRLDHCHELRGASGVGRRSRDTCRRR